MSSLNFTSRWPSKRLGSIFVENKDKNTDLSNTFALQFSYGNIVAKPEWELSSSLEETYKGYTRVNSGDIVINGLNLNYDFVTQRVGLVRTSGIITSAYILLRKRINVSSGFYCYYFKAMDSQKIFNGMGTGIRLTLSYPLLKNLNVPVPPRAEQDQIVRFLDWKVSSINKLIRTKIKEINLLRELKQVLINKELLAKSNRERVPLKRYVKSNRESLSERTSENHRIEYLDIGSVGYGYIKKKPKYYTFSEAPSRARRIVRSGDTIISTVRTYLRSVCYIDDDFDGCIVSTGFCVLTPNHQIVPEFLGFVLSSDAFINEVVRASVGTSYPAINESKLLSIKISLPEHIDEQRKIISDLSKKLEKIDRTISYINDLIVTYKELKTRLISDVVTGQIDVRNIEIPEYEYVDEELESDSDDVDGDFDSEDISEEA